MPVRRFQNPVQLHDVHNEGVDFWDNFTIATVVSDALTPGSYRVSFVSGQPLHATLQILFADEDHPPLVMALDPESKDRYAKVFQIKGVSCEIRLLVNPPVSANLIGRLEINRLSFAQLVRLGWQRLRWNMKTPKALLQKLRQVASGAGNFSLTPANTGRREEATIYAAWRDVFEASAERARLLTALKSEPEHTSEGVLAVYVTGTSIPGALEDFLEDIRKSNSTCQLNLLIVENVGAVLGCGLRDRALSAGATILSHPGSHLPLHLITTHAIEKKAEAFFFIERPGHFHDLAFVSFLLMLRQDTTCSAVYADHDVLDEQGERRKPWFKPEWSPDYAMALNYAGPAIAFRVQSMCCTPELELVGHAAPSYELLLRIGETKARKSIRRIPRVLFHEAFSEQEPTARAYRLRSEMTALEAFLRDHEDGSISERTEPGVLQSARRIIHPQPECPPLVSVIIPTKDNPVLLRDAAHSVLMASYPDKQLIIVENGSRDPDNHALMQELGTTHDVRQIHDPRPFNFSALINAGRKAASGGVIVLLNDDIKATNNDWLRELVSLATRPGIGCVGALLLYPDDTVQHAGIVMGIHGAAGHAFRHVPIDGSHPHKYLGHRREVSAVTGACLAVRSEVFDELGGLDETLPVTLNDVDFCLRARKKGYRNIFTPYAQLYHFESQTRGLDVTPERLARLSAETAKFMCKWGLEVLDDPYYSPHLSKSHEDFRMRIL